MITGILCILGYMMSVLAIEDARDWRDFAVLWNVLKSVGWAIGTGMFSLDSPRPKRGLIHLRPPELQPADACKHPEDSLVEVRSDAFRKGELVATLCTECDAQLGPEVWQAIMDRKFDEWTREHQSQEEARAARDRAAAEKAAEQADLAAISTEKLQGFLEDAGKTLGGLSWGVSGEQDARREEIRKNCAIWRAELRRRGVKEIPSWHRKVQEKLTPKRAPEVDMDSLYVQVMPNLDWTQKANLLMDAMLEPTNIEAAGLSDWRDCGWTQVAPPVTTTRGTRLVLKQERSGQTREFNFFSQAGAMNFLSR